METFRQDLYTGLEIDRTRTRVTRIQDGIIEVNNGAGLLTVDGATIKNQFVRGLRTPAPGAGHAGQLSGQAAVHRSDRIATLLAASALAERTSTLSPRLHRQDG